MGEAIAKGIYFILRHMQGYRLEHFWADDFYAPQFFCLLEMLNEEMKEKEKAYEKASKGKK